jgi:murein DD-endopeptidase MepM/ murein hydrolase activator NlpD
MSSFNSPRRRMARAALAFAFFTAVLPLAAAAEVVYHVLERGETLYSVARAYGIKPDALAKANSIEDPSRLKSGMKLLIPGATNAPGGANTASASGAPGGANATNAPDSASDPAAANGRSTAPKKYKVAKGDTLFSIARSFGVGLDALRAANQLNAGSVLKSGDSLIIPGMGGDKLSAPSPSAGPTMPDPVKTSAKAVAKGLTWPCPGEIVYLDGKAFGVIIKAKLGEAEKAVAAGTVSSAGPYRGYGNVVFVLSRSGHIYVYGGNDRISVRAGDRIAAGQELGNVGMDAKQGGPVAYFLVFKNGEAVDPAEAPRD